MEGSKLKKRDKLGRCMVDFRNSKEVKCELSKVSKERLDMI